MVLGEDWVDPDDPTVIAENELLGAAASIDAAATKLANLRPRRTSIKVRSSLVVWFTSSSMLFFSSTNGRLLLHIFTCLFTWQCFHFASFP